MNSLKRYSAVYCETADLFTEMNRLNSNGWVVTSVRCTERVNELSLQVLYLGPHACKKQAKVDFIIP